MLGMSDLTFLFYHSDLNIQHCFLRFFCDDKYTCFFLVSNQVAKSLTLKMVKQPTTLKTLMQKILELNSGVKNFTFSILSSLEPNFFTTFLVMWQINCVQCDVC